MWKGGGQGYIIYAGGWSPSSLEPWMSIVRSAQYSTDKLSTSPHNTANNTTAYSAGTKTPGEPTTRARPSNVTAVVTLRQNASHVGPFVSEPSGKVKHHKHTSVMDSGK